MDHLVLPPESAFSKAVFQAIRPRIPRERWPMGVVRATFSLSDDGVSLDATFDEFPPTYAAVAKECVRLARVDLVIKSPVALIAQRLVKIKRWRDTFLYGFVPSLFGIPLMAILGGVPMRFAAAIFCLDLMGLIWAQGVLMRQRHESKQAVFIANVPSPGLRLGNRQPDRLSGLDELPEI